ncbi:unannotated protein [freshwater metagenome]|uniref:Unannotated protein n=1 Tax=freshwater metagenome TaxID=449393 RepID=A0A6J6ZVH7_9ZZZZ
MIDVHFVFLGVVIALIGELAYARDTLRGTTQPNRVTWVLWSVAPLLAFVAELRQGVGLQSLMTFMMGFGPLIVLTASFMNKRSVWKIGPFDIACGMASVAGLGVWVVSSNNTVALVSFMIADGLACLPTLVKSYSTPSSESANAYLSSLVCALLTLATVKVWTSAVVAFPLQIAIFNAIEIIVIVGRIGPRLRGQAAPESLAPKERMLGPRKPEVL